MLSPKSPHNYFLKTLHRILVWASFIIPKWCRVYITPGIVSVGEKKSNPDLHYWYNNKEYLYKFIKAKGSINPIIEKQYKNSKRKIV